MHAHTHTHTHIYIYIYIYIYIHTYTHTHTYIYIYIYIYIYTNIEFFCVINKAARWYLKHYVREHLCALCTKIKYHAYLHILE